MRLAYSLFVLAALQGGAVGTALAEEIVFDAVLSGANLVPPADTPAQGLYHSTFETGTHDVVWGITYAGLSGPVTAIRFHGPAGPGENADVATEMIGDLRSPILGGSTFSPANVQSLMDGNLYIVIYTEAFPEGELRGQLVAGEVLQGDGEPD